MTKENRKTQSTSVLNSHRKIKEIIVSMKQTKEKSANGQKLIFYNANINNLPRKEKIRRKPPRKEKKYLEGKNRKRKSSPRKQPRIEEHRAPHL